MGDGIICVTIKGIMDKALQERAFVRRVGLRFRLPMISATRPSPLEPSREVLYSGESLFQVDVQPAACKICHGVNGNGLGLMAQGLNPSPRNFTCEETMKEISDGQLFWIIRNGSQGTGMPAFKDLKDREIWQIVHYLRQFPQPRRR